MPRRVRCPHVVLAPAWVVRPDQLSLNLAADSSVTVTETKRLGVRSREPEGRCQLASAYRIEILHSESRRTESPSVAIGRPCRPIMPTGRTSLPRPAHTDRSTLRDATLTSERGRSSNLRRRHRNARPHRPQAMRRRGADPGGRRFPFVMHRPSRRAPSTPPSAGAASRSRPNGPFFGGWGGVISYESPRPVRSPRLVRHRRLEVDRP
jgi:hypothetical protein